MRRSRTETAESRQRIVKAASHLMRERGAEQVSVADIMTAAGMTHGGFYVHFPDKDALLAEATKEAFSEKLDQIDSEDKAARAEALRSYIDGYMTLDHVLDPGFGCPIAGLGPNSTRAVPVVRKAMSEGAERTITTFARDLPKLRGSERENAIRTLISMVGSLVVARALKGKDLQKEVIDIMRKSEPLRTVLRPSPTSN